MAPSLDIGIALIAIGPFIAAVLAPFIWRVVGSFAGWLLALVPVAIFALLTTFIEPVAAGQLIHARITWIPAYGIDLSFLIDGLSLTFALVISGIGALIVLYSAGYLKDHPHQGRFLAFMLMFMGAMLGLVLADNLIALYGFWELTAVTSFILIGFDHTRQAARRAAVQALVVTSAGGLCLLFGALLLQRVTGAWDLSAMLGHGTAIAAHPLYGVIFVLFALGAFTKSAQFPFHFWLPNAMEAPTPVSAYLHSATMVQAGVYLLARTSPILGGTPLWSTILVLFGGVTLVWGAVGSLRQTDLKQMLAQTTIASLGLLVLLLGLGSEAAVTAAVVYFVAHAFYKAGFFLIAGLIDHETGVRDITALGGLRENMALSFIAAGLAAVSMLGLPPALGYLAKEAMYGALGPLQWAEIVVPVVLVGGNAALGAIALALLIKPFMGATVPTPKEPHEGPVSMLAGPLILGVLGIAAAVLLSWSAAHIIGPAASAIAGHGVESHLVFSLNLLDPALWLSLLTWALSGLLFWRLDLVRTLLRRLEVAFRWSLDIGFDQAMFALIGLAALVSRFWQHGRLQFYLMTVFVLFGLALLVPLLGLGGLSGPPAFPTLNFYEWGAIALAVIGMGAVVFAETRLVAIVSLGVQGLAVALIYLLFGAPDLSFTQFIVEILSVVIFALVMTRLHLDRRDRRSTGSAARDGALALVGGAATVLVVLGVLAKPLDGRLSAFFEANAVPLAHGRNIVNVILVDFRGLDTLGEISVVMIAGLAILALIGTARAIKPEPSSPRPAAGRRAKRAPSRKRAKAEEGA